MRGLCFLAAAWLLAWNPRPGVAAPEPSPADAALGGLPSRAELQARRAKLTNAPVNFLINTKNGRLEVRNFEGNVIEEYAPGTIRRVLDVGSIELKVSYGRDEQRRLSLLVRPGPAQQRPVQISVFGRRLILPPGTGVSATMEKDEDVVVIEPCLTGTIYYLDTQPTPVEVPAEKVRMVTSKNLVRIGRDLERGELPTDEELDAVVKGSLAVEEKQTPQNNAGVAVGSWLQNASVSLLGLPNPQATPPATVVKVASATPELSAPAPQSLTPNFDRTPVPSGAKEPSQELTQSLKVIAVRPDPVEAALPRKPLPYEEGSRQDLQVAARTGLKPRPLEDPSLAPPPPAATLNQKPPGDVAGNAVVKALRSFLGMPEAKTVEGEARQLSGSSPTP